MNRKSILMISSTSIKGGGPEHMIKLGKNISNKLKVFYALPQTNQYEKILNKSNHIIISERKISLLDLLKLIKFIKKNRIHIIHSHGKGAGLIGRILKIFVNKPLVYTFHGFHVRFYNKYIKKIYFVYENIFGKLDSLKIFVSDSEKRFAKNCLIFNEKKYAVINNAVHNNEITNFNLDQINLNNSIEINNGKDNIVSVCRLVHQKNIYEIIYIAKLLPEYNFIIIGDGPLMSEIKLYLSKNRIKNVYMIGLRNNVFKYLYASKLYLSTSFYEGLSISILEAMSIGLPIIASKVIGNVDAIKHDISGYLYELGNIQSARNYIKNILNDKKLLLRLSQSSYESQRKFFSYSEMVSKYLDIYKNI